MRHSEWSVDSHPRRRESPHGVEMSYVDRDTGRLTLSWPSEIPIDGQPADLVAMVEAYGRRLLEPSIPKTFVNAEPGSILTGRQREYCPRFAKQREIQVAASHFVPEDAACEIGQAVHQMLVETAG